MLFVHVPELTSDDLYEIYFLCFMTQYKIARLKNITYNSSYKYEK